MSKPKLSRTNLPPGKDIESDEYYRVEFSVRGGEDWFTFTSRTFDSEEGAEDFILDQKEVYGYDFRIVRVRTEYMEVARTE